MTGTLQLRPPRNRVSPKAIWHWTLRGLLGWLVVLGAQGVWLLADLGGRIGAHLAGLAGTVVVAGAHLVVMPRWRYRVHRWEATREAVYTQEGWFSQEQRIAPISRVQTVDSERGPFQQLFGLATVTVTTASAAGALKIEDLDHEVAQRLLDELTTITQATPGDAT
jgi:membrane protein YdbS with pleckstrin-like domain